MLKQVLKKNLTGLILQVQHKSGQTKEQKKQNLS